MVEGDALLLAQQVARELKAGLKVHRQFQTAVIDDWKGIHLDFVSARKEQYPYPGALPVVSPSGLDDDLFRRDFTINAMAVSINKTSFGSLIDPYGGLKDLKKGIIRVFHEKSFIDDPTRILRAVRFEQRFCFKFSTKTGQLLRSAIKTGTDADSIPAALF